MKKLFIFIGALILLIIVALITVPIIFKDDIKAAIDKELDNALNAQVYYDTDAFSLSLIRSFPNLSVNVGNFGIVGEGVFSQDTLAAIGEFGLTLDIMSVINGDQIKIVNVSLIEPIIKVKVLEDGKANYDIAAASTEETTIEEPTSDSDLNIQIANWEIVDGTIIYEDQTLPMLVNIDDLNHQGAGDFAQDIFDMTTNTTASAFTLWFDNVKYISQKPLNIDLIMAMDFESMTFTFKENTAALSDFAFGFDGFVAMPTEDINVDIKFSGKDISMRSVISLIPGAYQEYLDGVKATGLVSFDGFVKGTYNLETMPVVSANLHVDNGSILYADYPVPMKEINIRSNFLYPSADLRETSFTMETFHMSLDGEEVTASLFFKNLEDYFWDFKLDGNVDLEKITKIFPLEDMSLTGKMNGKFSTKGKMSDLEAEKYQALTSTGSLSIADFEYVSPDLPQGFGITTAKMSFDPKQISLEKFQGHAGKTDLNMDGKITNYMEYALAEDATLYGQLNYSSQLVDVNEWMVATDTVPEEPVDTTALEVLRIPTNIDFVLASNINQLVYDNLNLENFEGQVIVREGNVNLNKVSFGLLKGLFEMSGTYASVPEIPEYSFDFDIEGLSIPASYQAFNTIQKMAPVAEKMRGDLSSTLTLSGKLNNEMAPVYESMQGYARLLVNDGSLDNLELLEKVSKVTKLSKGEDGSLQMRDVDMDIDIVDGKIFVKPFDVVLGGRKATISGSTAVDGYMEYEMLTNVPTGKIGDAANGVLSSFLGDQKLLSNSLDVTLGIEGTYEDYKVKLLNASPGGSGGSSAKSAIADATKEKLDAAKKQAADELAKKKAEAEKLAAEKKAEAEKVAKEKADEVKRKAEEAAEKAKLEAEEKAKEAIGDKAKDKVKDLFGKKKDDGKK